MFRVERLAARVTLDDPASPLAQAEQAAAAGDESWQRWVEEYRSGSALIVRLETTLEAADGNGEPLVIQVANRGVFLEKANQPPKVDESGLPEFDASLSELEGPHEPRDRGHHLRPRTHSRHELSIERSDPQPLNDRPPDLDRD
jgi:hypothetical protein